MWSTEKVTLDRYLIPTMSNNSLIQIGGPEKGQCGMRAEASSTHNRHETPALPSLSSLPPKPKLEQEFSSHRLELDANEVDVPVCSAGNVPLIDKGFDQALSDNRWRPYASIGCEPNITWLAVFHPAMNPHVDEQRTFDNQSSIAC